jgi:hypothetical protein
MFFLSGTKQRLLIEFPTDCHVYQASLEIAQNKKYSIGDASSDQPCHKTTSSTNAISIT